MRRSHSQVLTATLGASGPLRENKLGAGDYFVGGVGEDEFYVALRVGFEGLRDVDGGESDFLVPVSVGVVVAASVEDAVGDGVVLAWDRGSPLDGVLLTRT